MYTIYIHILQPNIYIHTFNEDIKALATEETYLYKHVCIYHIYTYILQPNIYKHTLNEDTEALATQKE